MGEDLKRLAVLEARAAVADLVHTYALNVREGRGAECGKLFTEDAHFEVREATSFGSDTFLVKSTVSGREAVSAYVARSSSPETRVCPTISNLIVSVDGDSAESSCVMTNTLLSTGQTMLGEYRDRFRFEDRWRFTSRIFTIIRAQPPEEKA